MEISEDVFLISREDAIAYKASIAAPAAPSPDPCNTTGTGGTRPRLTENQLPGIAPPHRSLSPTPIQPELFPHIEWSGEVPAQKWMNFYTKVVSKFAAGQGVKLKVTFEAAPEGGVSKQKLEETRAALRELGLGWGCERVRRSPPPNNLQIHLMHETDISTVEI